MDAKKFGAFIAEMRKEKNMTQADLAEKLQVTDKAVSRWERGLGFPDIGTLEPLAAALGVSILELMRSERAGEEPPSGENASQAISAALALARREKARREELRNGLLALIVAGLLAVTLLFWRVGSVLATVIFFIAYLAAILCGCYLGEAGDQKSRTISLVGLVAAAEIALVSARYLMPYLAGEQYGRWLLLASAVYGMTYWIILTIQSALGADGKKKTRLVVNVALCVLMLALCLHNVGQGIQEISDTEERRRSNAVTQYAQALLEGEAGVKENQLTGSFTTYLSGGESEPDGCTVVFIYRLPGEDKDRAYGFRISVDKDMSYTVEEQGEALGESYVTIVEETAPAAEETS